MKKMRQLCALALVAVMAISSFGCQKQGGEQTTGAVKPADQTTAAPAKSAQTDAPAPSEAVGDLSLIHI